ncbi:MAG TPA: hypothetical protein VJ720_02390 [Chitinophaga sp.]|nr:hypothetical protein [Chitinophaga sp.]
MRSLIAFIACTSFIVWAHSCEKRIVGVRAYAHHPVPVPEGFSQKAPGLQQHQVLFAHQPKPVKVDALSVSDPGRLEFRR